MSFHRVAIVNRGEPAMRFINAAAEINRAGGETITSIALYTEPDRRAWFVREADEAVCIGPASKFDPVLGREILTYLDYDVLEHALTAARAEAVWVGWGFVAEHAEFADLCDKLGVVFIGPTGDAMRRIGDKIGSKLLAEEAGLSVVPWSGGPVDDLNAAVAAAELVGYPLFVKATSGGGGRGIRRVATPSDLAAAFAASQAEARRTFGDPTVFLERQITNARHVEVQVIADHHDTVWAVGLRDCTLQRRHQKVIEESACTLLDSNQQLAVRRAAAELCRRAGYTNAGTVEFLYSPAAPAFHFMEMNARLQVEHPVTELTTGVDLVKLQIAVARGERLADEPPPAVGHAIEARLNAEDPDRQFAPAPGRIRWFRPPTGPGIRVDTGVAEGDEIPAEYDSMIAKIVAWGRDRQEARGRLARALTQTQVIVDGGRTNKAFLLALLGHPDVIAGRYDTDWLDARMENGELLEPRHAGVALLCAAVEAYEVEHALARSAFYAEAGRGRPATPSESGHRIEFRYRGRPYVFRVFQVAPTRYRIATGSSLVDLDVERLGEFEQRVAVRDRRHRVVSSVLGPVHTVDVDDVAHTIARDEGGVVRAPAPAVVVRVSVAPGDAVAVGDPLVVLESMKMETVVTAEFPARVRTLLVRPNMQVDAGAPLLQLEPFATEAETGRAAAVDLDFGPSAITADDADALRAYLLGYDLDPVSVGQISGGGDPWHAFAVDEPDRLEQEAQLLGLFADLCSISRRLPEPVNETGERLRPTEEHLLTCLRSRDINRDRLPQRFIDRLLMVLRHYGLTDLSPSADLDDALMRVFHSQQRLGQLVPEITAILDRRLAHVELLRGHADDALRTLLDHLIDGTDGRYPSLSDLARAVRFHYLEQQVVSGAQAGWYAEMDAHMGALTNAADGPERKRHMTALVACPQPMRPRLLRWYQDGDASVRDVVREVAARRYYRIRDLREVRSLELNDQGLAVADYEHNAHPYHLMVGFAAVEDLPSLLGAVGTHLATVDDDVGPILDVHLWQHDRPDDEEVIGEHLRRTIDSNPWERSAHRIDVTLTVELLDEPLANTYHYTFRSTPQGVVEEQLYRNLHPMLAKRLDIDRLCRFAITRLDSAEDVYLFHGVARDNAQDERLFALAEVRDLTPLHDATGATVGFPLLERVLTDALTGIRRFQSHRAAGQRLLDNTIMLDVRPPWSVPADTWRELAHKLAPATRGLGIDQVISRVTILEDDGGLHPAAFHVTNPGARGVLVRRTERDSRPIEPLDGYGLKAMQTQRRGGVYPYELIRLLTPPEDTPSDFPAGDFTEYDLDDDGRLVAVDRPYGQNTANVVTGVISNRVEKIPEGMRRVFIAGDPSRSLGALAEPECRRIVAAIDLAEQLNIPLEWFAMSSGARISMTSGTENMDWIGAVLRRIITFTDAGGEINIVVTGINVGAQPYWNAEATMLMHTRGILVMLPGSAMVLTGKQALDFSGGVSAEDNLGIGGFERIMGPNGQAQYGAPDLESACEILFRHYEHTYVVPGERFPRRATTADEADRDVCLSPHASVEGAGFATVGEVFSATHNLERKKPFDIRSVMRAVSDVDWHPLERWTLWRDADTAVVWDAHLGGIPVSLIGFESRPVPREGLLPRDGPSAWTSGTLFPQSSRKVARAINAASGNRPIVVLANLSGFDGSPESMRKWQLEYGAEIGRAVTHFDGPIVFAVISRYHGGAFVVFSKLLNENLEVVAVEGSYASVIGGAPAAAVVFAREVDARTRADQRVVGTAARDVDAVTASVRSEKLGEVADEFDHIHSIQRALEVGSVDRIIPASALRPYLIGAVERGMERVTAGASTHETE